MKYKALPKEDRIWFYNKALERFENSNTASNPPGLCSAFCDILSEYYIGILWSDHLYDLLPEFKKHYISLPRELKGGFWFSICSGRPRRKLLKEWIKTLQ